MKMSAAAAAEADHDSEEEDEDYVPPAEGEQSDDDGAVGGPTDAASGDVGSCLPAHKQRAVDDAFASLFGGPTSAGAASSASTAGGGGGPAASKKKGKKRKAATKRALKKKKALLASMFGSAAADKLLSTSAAVAGSAAAEPSKRRGPLQAVEKRLVTERKVFAGREVEVKRTVMEPAAPAAAAAAATKPPSPPAGGGGIDSVLADLAGPQKLSTVAKTSSDWDTFKDRTGLDEELEEKAKGKDAYLVKQDFLQRVDQRTFEVEKAERDRKRAAQGK